MQGNVDFLAAPQQSNQFPSILILILIVGAFYFFLIRPQNKRRREQVQMQSAVEAGAQVITTNGMYATVTAVEDDHLVLEIAPGVEARFLKQAIMQVVTEDTDETEDTGEEAAIDEPKGDESAPKKSEGQTPEQPSA